MGRPSPIFAMPPHTWQAPTFAPMRGFLMLPLLVLACPSHAQFGEKVRRFLNGDSAAGPDYDTAYVLSYSSTLTLTALASYRTVDVDLEQPSGNTLTYSTNTPEQYGLGLDYKWLSVEASFTVPALGATDPSLGESRSRGLGIGYTGRRLWARGFWNSTKGYYLNEPARWMAGWKPGDAQVTRGDLSSDTYMASLNWALSRKRRYSQNAALYQMERQKRSAGTFVAGFSAWRTVVAADSSLIGPALVDTFQLASGFTTVRRTLIGASIGYMHTFSFWHKGFLNAAFLPGLAYAHQVIGLPDGTTLTGTGAGSLIEMKLGAGYNGDSWYTALTFSYYYSTTPIADNLNLASNYTFGRFALGVRLGALRSKALHKVGL